MADPPRTAALIALALGGITVGVSTGLAERYLDEPVRSLIGIHDIAVARAVVSAGDGGVALVVVAAAGAIALFRDRPVQRLLVLVAGTAASAVTTVVLKRLVDRGGSYDLTPTHGPGGLAFPSGHVVTVTVVAGLITWVLHEGSDERRHRLALRVGLTAGALEGTCLLLLRQHWLTDIVAGLLLAALWLLLCTLPHPARDRIDHHGYKGATP